MYQDQIANEEIRDLLNAENKIKEIKVCQLNWIQHINAMKNRLPKLAYLYNHRGQRHVGRPRSRRKDEF
jgi:hypothetical protein